jgi:hypothetical protein
MDDAVIRKEDDVIVKDNVKTENGVMDVNYDDAVGENADRNESSRGEIKILEELTPQKDPLAAPPPENEMVENVIEALKRAQRNFQETFYETPPVDPTVRRSTRPVLPGCGAYVPNRTSSAIYEDSDSQFYS